MFPQKWWNKGDETVRRRGDKGLEREREEKYDGGENDKGVTHIRRRRGSALLVPARRHDAGSPLARQPKCRCGEVRHHLEICAVSGFRRFSSYPHPTVAENEARAYTQRWLVEMLLWTLRGAQRPDILGPPARPSGTVDARTIEENR